MASKSFDIGDFVWAKMKHYCPWPGKIVDPPANAKSPKSKKLFYYVLFFGTNNHAFVEEENIFLHNNKLVEKFGNQKKGNPFKAAVQTIIEESAGISKYQEQSNENLKTESNKSSSFTEKDSETQSDKIAKNVVTHKTKKAQYSTVPKKMRRTSIKKVTTPQKSSREDLEDFLEPSEIGYSPRKIEDSDDDDDEESYSFHSASVSSDMDFSFPIPQEIDIGPRAYRERQPTPPVDLSYVSDEFKKKDIEPPTMTIGFIGLGEMGQRIVKILLQSGHFVTIWNRTGEKCIPFRKKFKNIKVAASPSDVVVSSDITFCCVSDTEAAKVVAFGTNGVLKGMERSAENKGFVQLTSMDPEVSISISEEVRMKRGRYLEAPLSGSRLDASDGTLYIAAGGDMSLYDDCKSCLDAMTKVHTFLSAVVGYALKLSLVHKSVVGGMYVAYAESMALLNREGFAEDFLEISEHTKLHEEPFISMGRSMIRGKYFTKIPIKHMVNDLNLTVALGSQVEQPTLGLTAAKEVYTRCKKMKYGNHDVTAVFEGLQS